jgi:hypothetical protein
VANEGASPEANSRPSIRPTDRSIARKIVKGVADVAPEQFRDVDGQLHRGRHGDRVDWKGEESNRQISAMGNKQSCWRAVGYVGRYL